MPPARRRPTVLAAALAATLAGTVHAASFDCHAARTATEKAVCASPALSALDEQLARDYQRALAALSPAGAARLKESQRSWLHFVGRVCAPRKGAGPGDSVAHCLQPEFTQRRAQLAQAGVRVGPWVFSRVDAWGSARVRGDLGAHAGFVTQHVAYAQVDAPLTPATLAWNAAQRKETPGDPVVSGAADDVPEDDDTDYTLGCAGDRFISLQVDNAMYQHGAAHGSYDHEVHNAVLAPAYRAMAATDIFAPGAAWKATLPALFLNTWLRGNGAGETIASQREAIQESAANPDRWLITPAGLQISFDADEAGCYACNPGPITVPWAALTRLLAAPDLAACKGPPPTAKR